ncbi:NAD-dependent epimerase/dehydratase family protein [Sulfurospirillum barnesii]|uniref:Nucleoside-diphosphate-sugar epimerase n=1 Tax=Sulfurospirillum barnesii (strain ATCC 700032 / DSM 10660 / SES-3) TaxID=760154 RepID=I3XYW2_SULBS|nr:NAD-dependent epimerase/dehydratase family protein [Sulfurospirillum barnesii]AFL69136.1 nucleoside-diphosphate-sugar epimerase [Sulfurospirillum barnesii SES-3]
MKHHVLVTGASEFIGGYFTTHYSATYNISFCSFHQENLDALALGGISTILHLSAIVHQPNATQALCNEFNVSKTVNLALKAKEAGVKQFVFMSTIAVYDTSLTFLNEDSLLNPATFYGQSKLEAEKQLLALEDEHFKVSIIRPPMVYGANAPGNIKSLMKLIDKVPILPFGGIMNQRSFVYVGNLCAMIDCIMKQRQSGIFLASDDAPLSTTQLIEHIARAKNKKKYLLHVKLFEYMLRWLKPSLYQRLFCDLVVDNSQTKATLDFKNPYRVEEGIRLMIEGEKE